MSASQVHKRRRNTCLTLEHLDMRIAPSAMGAAATLAAELKVEGRRVARWEAALATAAPGSHHQQVLENHIARTEHRMSVQEVRLARIEARVLARAQASPLFRVKGQPPPNNPPSPIFMPFSVAAPTATTALTSPTPPTTASNPPSGSTTTGSSGGGADSGSTSSLPPNASAVLNVIYDAYISNPSDFNIPPTAAADHVVIDGTNVGIQVHANSTSDFNNLVSELQAAGMQITASSAANGLVMGMLPIAQLPAVAGLPEAPSVTAMYRPLAR